MERPQAGFSGIIGTNSYVPKMQYASGLIHGAAVAFSLGSPAAVSANSIVAAANAQAVAGVITTLTTPITLDGTYGRSLRLTPSADPGNSAAITITGRDYLGQPMAETFTGANGATAILYGKKAFKYVDSWKTVTAATNAVTWAVGTGWRLGLPFKGDISWAKENGVFVPLQKRDFTSWVERAAALAVAGGSNIVSAPCAGFVKTLIGIPNGGGGVVDPVITVELGNTAIVGLTVTVDTSDTSQLKVTDVPTTVGYNANNRFRAGDSIEIVAAAAAGAFGDEIGIEITPTQFSLPVTTDPQTLTTGDPRGTYEANLTYDGSEIIVGMVSDPSYNATGNGGLHGIRHVIS